ncbi:MULTISPECIES: Stp1/IreP family PP2C-type Ser/Thr phosphatase [Janibacter]|uniref:Stp1/IreP family PP2C-type Ser/Thr phosphatase n=1 Tax=Janibacter TaxID=53457 RepID=UPI0021A5C7DD|nr:Stp1/IreP family PP2C-type Ser/Thr phosphatase [Janibacter hoylei]MCT1619132.1 Stp1/IreP family PP2C-type Ser/Thr phosphatase [Janibacter hoylei]MCT2293222.1 Stp1/IreP family PP2C-type Ser/Thr phosphatase [Janibacter hoylei]
MALTFHYAARSDVGLVRKDNQDSGYAGPHLLVVADGMGGHAGGDIASATVVTELVEIDHDSLTAAEASTQLGRAITAANDEIARTFADNPELEGMGTTVTAIMRARNKLILAHIGDSRAYLLREGRLAQITKDHSFVQTLIDEGRITEDEASTHPQRSVVTRVLTGDAGDEPDIGAREARLGDRYMLCSDGLSGFVALDTIEEILTAGISPGRAADDLVSLALRAGAPDNVTVVVADVVDSGTGPSTQPQVVGSAALRRPAKRVDTSPAARAAALTAGDDDEEVELAEESPSRRARWLRRIGGFAVALLLLGAVAYGGYAWTQQQYYVGARDGHVTIFRGVAQDLGPITLHTAVDETDIEMAELPSFYRDEVEATISVDSRPAADERVASLRAAAEKCGRLRATGEPCGR